MKLRERAKHPFSFLTVSLNGQTFGKMMNTMHYSFPSKLPKAATVPQIIIHLTGCAWGISVTRVSAGVESIQRQGYLDWLLNFTIACHMQSALESTVQGQ